MKNLASWEDDDAAEGDGHSAGSGAEVAEEACYGEGILAYHGIIFIHGSRIDELCTSINNRLRENGL